VLPIGYLIMHDKSTACATRTRAIEYAACWLLMILLLLIDANVQHLISSRRGKKTKSVTGGLETPLLPKTMIATGRERTFNCNS